MSKAITRGVSQVLLVAALPPDQCGTALRRTVGARDLAPHLPSLRRYASALTCSQSSGDAYVRAALSALLVGDRGLVDEASSYVGLYRLFHVIWATVSARFREDDERMEEAGPRISGVAKRAILLLTSMEVFSMNEIAFITDLPAQTVRRIVGDAARGAIIHATTSAHPTHHKPFE
jgi:DNA-directed RNA polymerase specialized sigma24 family protein